MTGMTAEAYYAYIREQCFGKANYRFWRDCEDPRVETYHPQVRVGSTAPSGKSFDEAKEELLSYLDEQRAIWADMTEDKFYEEGWH